MFVLENENVLFDAVKEGVKSGVIGAREGPEVYHKQDVLPMMDSVILRSEIAKKMKEGEAKIEGKGDKKEDGTVKKVTLRAKVPWDKLSSIISGVIRPLKDKGRNGGEI